MQQKNNDQEIITKQIERSKLKIKLIVTVIILFVAIILWSVINFFMPKPSLISQEYLKLASKFTFTIKEDVLSSLDDRKDYSDEQLKDFVIYTLDESSANKLSGNMVIEINGENKGKLIPLDKSETPEATTSPTINPLSDVFAN